MDNAPVIEQLPISVIVTVRNDAAGMRALLEALLGQTRRPDEIVVVDAGFTDGTQQVLATFDSDGVPFRWLARAGINIAAGRNLAITEATHELIACTDSGCVPDSTWLEELCAPFADPQVMVVGGGYRVCAHSALERVVGLLTMPGELKPIEPARFNPSARSLAFRREAWRRADGLPDWLMTAEDTLFACKLRRNREVYVYAESAVVRWRPRPSLAAVWRQFRNYARGEAHIRRGENTVRYWTRRYALIGSVASVSTLAALVGGGLIAIAGWLMALAALVAPIHVRAAALARRTSRASDYFRAIVISHWVTLAGLCGHARGRRDQQRDPLTYRTKLQTYWGAAAVDDCPPWNMPRPPTPRTLIVSWHWPPTNRASTQVLSNLFNVAPAGVFHGLTRALPVAGDDPVAEPAFATHRVPWMLPDDRERTLCTWVASMLATWRMIVAARRLHRDAPFQRVLSVHPHRYSLLTGWIIARFLGIAHVAYMHDLCAETLITRSRLKRWFWTGVDRAALSSAFLVVAPTREFALHYRSRGAMQSWVLPHCNPPDALPRSMQRSPVSERLRVLYAGSIYQAHEEAVRQLIRASDALDFVELEFLCPPNKVVPAPRARWVDRAAARAAVRDADVLVVALSGNTPYPREIQGCFPSKLVDYLAAARPILAIVPPNCFVDRFVRGTGCGVSVTSEAPRDIARVLTQLRDAGARTEMGAASAGVSAELDAATWMRHLCSRLALGAPIDPSTPPFPRSTACASDSSAQPIAALAS